MKSSIKFQIGLVVILFLFQCGGSGDSNNANFNQNNTLDAITLYQIDTDPELDDLSFSQVEIPVGLFGETLEGATFSIEKAQFEALTDLEPADYLVEEVQLVAFNVYNVNDGDEITFTLFLANGGSVLYSGSFSESGDTLATLQAAGDEDTDETQQLISAEELFITPVK